MLHWSQHYHGQVLHWWEARSSICRREIGCQRSLVLELLREALLMKSDATNNDCEHRPRTPLCAMEH